MNELMTQGKNTAPRSRNKGVNCTARWMIFTLSRCFQGFFRFNPYWAEGEAVTPALPPVCCPWGAARPSTLMLPVSWSLGCCHRAINSIKTDVHSPGNFRCVGMNSCEGALILAPLLQIWKAFSDSASIKFGYLVFFFFFFFNSYLFIYLFKDLRKD